ncbi:MAG TPA: CotH kinase family protein, partial [Flavobacteriales bacterium]|nr:CotH kinase family protein [Flavobacteriales bacterium]
MHKLLLSVAFIFTATISFPQIIINEGSNKNYQAIADEDGEYEDWIELYNAGSSPVDIFNFSLSDDPANTTMWTFPHYILAPGAYKVIYLSGKNRYQTSPFTPCVSSTSYAPVGGWNTHTFTTPYNWDGVSNLVINVCSYSSAGYTVNSTFNQTSTAYASVTGAWQDGGPGICGATNGAPFYTRPNMQLNGITIGTGTIVNGNTDYPAPYGNWYWASRTQMLIPAAELTAAGLTAGNINSLAFDVVAPDPCTYDYVDIALNVTPNTAMTNTFIPDAGYNFHTNFKISGGGENIYLYNASGTLVSTLNVDCGMYDNSVGSFPDASSTIKLFGPPTPGATNNASTPYTDYAATPDFSIGAGFYTTPFTVSIIDFNSGTSEVRYTVDGSDPSPSSPLYTGPVTIFFNTVLKARAFVPGYLPSEIRTATYFINVSHITPILSVTTENSNLYGPTGMFDNYNNDWLKAGYAEYFDSTSAHNMIFSMPVGMIMDGGAGGSRSQPQHSFRIEMDNSVLGDESVSYPFIPDRGQRTEYGKFYLRNGSNQYLRLPYKEACQARMMCKETNTYYAAYRPVTVYINGQYFGLYELREKYDKQMFEENDNATDSTIEILSMSYFYGLVLRAVEGDVDNFWNDYADFDALNVFDPDYWEKADSLFDQKYYVDYIISESWMGNVDWPGNNIKIYRSDATSNRWRFATIDMELALLPNSWTDCNFDHINYMLGQPTSNPYINIWLQGMQNNEFKNYFINRYADVMNTSYDTTRLLSIEEDFFNQTVGEMPNEFQRWGNPWDIPTQMNQFNNDHQTFRNELRCRT